MTTITFVPVDPEDDTTEAEHEVWINKEKSNSLAVRETNDGWFILERYYFDGKGAIIKTKELGKFPTLEGAKIRDAIKHAIRKRVKPEDHMYSKQRLPRKAIQAILVIQKICRKFDELITGAEDEGKSLLSITTEEAVKALEGGVESGGKISRKAYLPPVYRHLIVRVAKNLRDPVPAVQGFTNNKRFMMMLDEAWSKTSTSTKPTETTK